MRWWARALSTTKRFDAVHPGEPHVDDGDVGARALGAHESIFARKGDDGAVPVVVLVRRDRIGEDSLVVDDQNEAGHGHAVRLVGNVRRKRAPPSAPFPDLTVPSLASTNFLARARPRPVPLGFVVKKGSKIFRRVSGGIPGPVSLISR